MIAALIFVAVFAVAYANGANANFKGVASLYGCGACGYETAVRWGTVTTALGSAAALVAPGALAVTFSGKGLVAEGLVGQPLFVGAVAGGAAGANLLATRLGFPVSTTHMLLGGLLGAGWVADAEGVRLGQLWAGFARPLLLGPVAAIVLGVVVYEVLSRTGLARSERKRLMDGLHFASAGTVCFARGMNDTPKMGALLLGAGLAGPSPAFLLVGLCMALGGLISARRVADTLAHKITDLDGAHGLAANVTTAWLVLLGTMKGLPLSTTHVTVGALLGMGMRTGKAKWRTVIPVLLAWVVTLPAAAVLAALIYRGAAGF